MHRIWRAGVVLVLLAVGLVVPTNAAQACSCGTGPPQQQFKGADAVFTGEIVNRAGKRWIDYGNASGPGQFTYTVEVDRVYKGAVAETQQFVSGTDGASCGVVFPKDGPILVYGSAGEGIATGKVTADQYSTSLCSGSRTTSTAPAAFGEGSPPPTSVGYVSAATPTAPDVAASSTPVSSSGPPIAIAIVAAVAVGLALITIVVFVARRRRSG